MRRTVAAASVVVVSLLASSASAAFGATSSSADGGELHGSITARGPVALPDWNKVRPRYHAPASFAASEPSAAEKKVTPGIPTFAGSVTLGRTRYALTMVGANPTLARAKNTTATVMLIPLIVTFDDGTVFDPTADLPECGGGNNPLQRVLDSPIVQQAAFADGDHQWIDEWRRAEFSRFLALNPSYSVFLNFVVGPTYNLTVHGFPTMDATCGRLGLVDINVFDNFWRTTMYRQLTKYGVNAKVLPMLLTSNVVLFNGDTSNCCTLGYHSVMKPSRTVTQTYGIASYDTTRKFHGVADIATITHELAEWLDDPFTTNRTPAWGGVGQVDGCTNVLEVGDPLTGTLHAVDFNGFVYHPQELAYFSWFFRNAPSWANGNIDEIFSSGDSSYSSNGTFDSPAPACN